MVSNPGDRAPAADPVRPVLATIAKRAAAKHAPGLDAAELLELLRLQLHREIDDVIDDEALRHPSPHRCIARTPRYVELQRRFGWGAADVA